MTHISAKDRFERMYELIGEEAVSRLRQSKVAVFGVGGVGSYTVEALARAGVGRLLLVDGDVVEPSNINRQLHATDKTIGQPKVEVMAGRVRDINPEAVVDTLKVFYLPDTEVNINWDFDYVVDAVDTVTAKLEIICNAKKFNNPVISAMGAGNKMKPECFEISDIEKTSVCPLARVMRYELKKRGISDVKVVYSKEKPQRVRSSHPASISFVPSVAGLLIAAEVIRDLTAWKDGYSHASPVQSEVEVS